MIEEVQDFFTDVKDKVGNKGFFLIIGGLVVAFLYFLTRGNGNNSEVTYNPPTTVNGYPDVYENADVVASSVASNIEYSKQEMLDYLEGVQNEIQGSMDSLENRVQGSIDTLENRVNETTEATNNYIQEGMEAVKDLSAKVDTLETQPQVQYVPQYVPSQQPANNMNNNNWLGDMANFVTSNGMTVAQNVGLLGTSYMGSTVTQVQTNHEGKTIITTKDGHKYQDGKLIS